ncbi:uncharacterized protein LOC113464425 [Ceratina calcarata]|uniref:Uncharacterized protein LOC113464425 n=1 Tax=Ceratina calcarata TaxID=156304 RepID=A0AAJ7WB47_9HYME|nr:uncharacterized protein LOC113464425 [Ceratina calcarata]
MKCYASLMIEEITRSRSSTAPVEIDFFTEPEVEYKGNINGGADIPQFRGDTNANVEYQDFPEEQVWSPREGIDEWFPHFLYVGQSCLTFAQERQGIPVLEAMVNACTDYSQQYITNVLHDSDYVPAVAWTTLLSKELPEKIFSKWKPEEIDRFVDGILEHGKNFITMQKKLFPQKDVKDIVEFFYAWEMTNTARKLRKLCPKGWRCTTKRRRSKIKQLLRCESVIKPKQRRRSESEQRRVKAKEHVRETVDRQVESEQLETERNQSQTKCKRRRCTKSDQRQLESVQLGTEQRESTAGHQLKTKTKRRISSTSLNGPSISRVVTRSMANALALYSGSDKQSPTQCII